MSTPTPKTAFDGFADTTLAAIGCNKAQATVAALLRHDTRFSGIAANLSEAGNHLNAAMRSALQIHQEMRP